MKRELIIGKYTLESLTNGMYASPLDMYREYVQNAVDSIDEAVTRRLDIPDKLSIDIVIDVANHVVTIRDNGVGVPAETAAETLLDIGNSQKSRMTSRGFRGIGRLAGLSYCDKLTFRTSVKGEEVATIIEFDAALLKELLFPGSNDGVSVADVVERIVTVKTEKETANRRYFEVRLDGAWNEAGLTDPEVVENYLIQHAPLRFSDQFKWGRTIIEKMRLAGYQIPQYKITLNGKNLFKPYEDTFISDRVKRNVDLIRDVKVEVFYRKDKLSAVLWYADTNFFGTIIENVIKGLRIRQGNILIGDKGSCSSLFKEERFNGWMIGELHILDPEIIANSRRDGFEKNSAYYELLSSLKDWAFDVSKEIRHLSYERSLTGSKKAVVEAEQIEDIADENDLYSEDLAYAEDYSESATLDQAESDELAETDFISKLGQLLNQKKAQTKYTALNINTKLSSEQRKVLERVFDLITQEYDRESAEKFVNTISAKF